MLGLLACALAAQQPGAPEGSAGGPGAGDGARRLTAEEIAACFPDAWRLPRADRGGRPLPNARFEAEMIRLAAEPLAAADEAAGRPALWLGDLLARATAAARAESVDEARRRLERLLAEAQKEVPAALWPRVRPLLDLRDFVSPKWDPDDEDERAGFLMGPTWQLPADCWPAHEGGRDVEQCATLMAADLASIKVCEADCRSYFRYPANSYLRVEPVAGSYGFHCPEGGRSAAGLACAAATTRCVDFENDLPFPFGRYELRLRMLTCLDEAGRPTTWVASDSSDFHWLAGYDLYEPVYDRDGAFMGTLVIRQFGADLDGVPDKSSHRHGGMRSVLGGLRRDAEAHFLARADRTPFPPRGAVPVP